MIKGGILVRIKKIGIVSLSSGVLGESFISHELKIGQERLDKYGVEVVFLPNALKGIEYLQENPKARAKDLLDAFLDDSIDMILCAIGGDDTHRLLPYLFDNKELERVVKPKVFLGFSDTTKNHFMLHKVGIPTFYGQAFLTDVCELSKEMLPYSRQYFEELLYTGQIRKINPSSVWYEERKDYSPHSIGVDMPSHQNYGFELLMGEAVFEGEIFGGCLDSLYKMLVTDCKDICQAYELFPPLDFWERKILLLETSEVKVSPKVFREMIIALKGYGLFDVVRGVLVGKPQDEVYYQEYKEILLEELGDKDISLVYNLNVGHASPRCIIPLGIPARVDLRKQEITFTYEKE